MTFEELYDSLRSLAENNKVEGFGSAWGPLGIVGGRVSGWTLQPDQVETIVEGISKLKEELNSILVAKKKVKRK